MFWAYDDPQFGQLQCPYNCVMGVSMTHATRVTRELRERDDTDLVHDHVEAVGPAVLGAMGNAASPVLHTLHWDLGKHPQLYGASDGRCRMWVNGVSAAHLARALAALRAQPRSYPSGHRAGRACRPGRRRGSGFLAATAVGTPSRWDASQQAKDSTLPRGWPTDSAWICSWPAGGSYHQPAALAKALTDEPDAAGNPDLRYWREQVMPEVDGQRVRWLGSVYARERN